MMTCPSTRSEDEAAVQDLAAKLAELPTAEKPIGFYAIEVQAGPNAGQFRAVCPEHGTTGGEWFGTSPTAAIKKAEEGHKHD